MPLPITAVFIFFICGRARYVVLLAFVYVLLIKMDEYDPFLGLWRTHGRETDNAEIIRAGIRSRDQFIAGDR